MRGFPRELLSQELRNRKGRLSLVGPELTGIRDLGIAPTPGDGDHYFSLQVGETIEQSRRFGVRSQPIGELASS